MISIPPKHILEAMKRTETWYVYDVELEKLVLREDAPDDIKADEDMINKYIDENWFE